MTLAAAAADMKLATQPEPNQTKPNFKKKIPIEIDNQSTNQFMRTFFQFSGRLNAHDMVVNA